MPDTPAKPRRRWLSFSLRTLFVMVAMLALPLGYAARELGIARERLELIGLINGSVDGAYTPGPSATDFDFDPARMSLSYLRTVSGDQYMYAFWLPGSASETDRRRFIEAFPEAFVAPLRTPAGSDGTFPEPP